MTRALGLMALCLLLACSESFAPPSSVTDLRVVGALVEVQDDPEVAEPAPGDDIEVSLLVIDKGAPPSAFPEVPALTPGLLQWTFAACIPAPILIGPPICADPQNLILPCEGCVATPPADEFAFPVMRFQVPSAEDLEAAQATQVLLQGVVCVHGVPSQDAILRFFLGETDDLDLCEPLPGYDPARDEAPDGRVVTVQIPLDLTDDDPNLNPEISNVFFNGADWPPPYNQEVPRTAPRTGCAADLSDEERAMQPVAGSEAEDIKILVPSESSETFTIDEVTFTEEIQVSWLADGGGFANAFSFITDPATDALIQWQPPTNEVEGGLLVRFTFVIRDGRGGTDWLERGLCVLPRSAAETQP